MKILAQYKNIPVNFIKCGIAGWCLEVLFTSLESIMIHDWRFMGRTSLLMFPIYGFGALLGPVASMIDHWLSLEAETGFRPKPVECMIRHGMIYMVLIFMAEYFFGFWLKAVGICPWDYTGNMASIHGLIRLDFAPLWFITGLIFEQITKKRGR